MTNILLAQAAHRTPPGSFALCESEATATTNVFCSDSKAAATNVFCSESKAAATNVLSARKRSVSGKCFICAKAKRQQQSAQSVRKSTTRYGVESFF
ncbi:hypothetical protein FJQ98_06425 [Lysinibacillus agricola]|uniref:Uncharacterized protein n=1 Tax=Lysinibacillus agricola TaxID=2590012 RepID=A0ABX7AX54_9BACI|nr:MULTISPECIES: hypothetical protein [Lysinibacillus]QQP13685.1 hypothetical protein FJQ98_06425 [Lysinibacillus agricola]